jgi:hypothetical protein
MDGAREAPPVTPAGSGAATIVLDDATGMVTVTGSYTGMTSAVNNAHIHTSASQCLGGGIVLGLTHTGGTSGTLSGAGTLTVAQVSAMLAGRHYINVHTVNNGPGEIRGQVENGIRFCNDCDGALALCPCTNPGGPETGCDNAQATGGALLTAPAWNPGGSAVTLQGTGFPPASAPTVIVIRSPSQQSPPVTFGDGLRCIGAAGLVRFGATTASGGTSTHLHSHGAGPGQFFYQLWYRNTPVSFCVTTGPSSGAFNLSNGLSLLW